MLELRNRPKGVRFAFFGLGLCVFALIPTEVGYQDIASLLARQPGVAERWQSRVFSAAATIQLATYSFGRPIGTSSPQAPTVQLASFENRNDITGTVTRNPIAQPPQRYQAADFPKVDRTLKGDPLVKVSPQRAPPVNAAPANEDPSTSNASVMGAKTADAVPSADHVSLDPELQAALSAPPLAQYDVSTSFEAQPLDDLKVAPAAAAVPLEPAPSQDGFSVKTASLFFGSSSLGASAESMERWQPGEEPMGVSPAALPDPDMKTATAPAPSVADEPAKAATSGESIAAKGEVNSDNQRAKTPAERLGLLDEKAL